MSRLRPVQIGRTYSPPPAPPGINPDECSTEAEWQHVVTAAAQQLGASSSAHTATVASGMVRGFRGVSPSLARDLCHAAGLAIDCAPAGLMAEEWSQLYQQWATWLDRLQSGSFACTSLQSGAYSMLAIYPNKQDSILEYMRTYYAGFQGEQDFKLVRTCRSLRARVDAA